MPGFSTFGGASPLSFGGGGAGAAAGGGGGGGFDWMSLLGGMMPTGGQQGGGGIFGGGGSLFGGQDSFMSLMGWLTSQNTLDKLRSAQDKTNAANEARYQDILGERGRFRGMAGERFDKLGDLVKRRGDDVLAGFDDAKAELGTAGGESRRRITDAGAQREASDVQDLASRGLGSTTVVDQRRRQTREEVDRNLADIDERVASLRSGLAERRAAAVQSTGRDLEDFIKFRTAFQGGLLEDELAFKERKTETMDPVTVLQAIQAGQGGGGFGGIAGGLEGLFNPGSGRRGGTIGALTGGAIGGYFGGPIGAALGAGVGRPAGSSYSEGLSRFGDSSRGTGRSIGTYVFPLGGGDIGSMLGGLF